MDGIRLLGEVQEAHDVTIAALSRPVTKAVTKALRFTPPIT